jgi:DNA-directed RNA polymerase subunit RPC12/RpoP
MADCPKCGTKLVRKPDCYAWRGVSMHGWVCVPCGALWDLKKAFLRYVRKHS